MKDLALIIPVIVYFLILISFNLFVKYLDVKKGSSQLSFLKNYAISDRNLSAFALAMTSASTYASASSFISGPGAAYNYGLGWVVVAMIQVPTMWFAFMVIGDRINKFANKHNCATVNDILMARYKSVLLTNITSLMLVLCFIASIVVQLIGAARLLEGYLNIDYRVSLICFTAVIAVYTFFGNFKTVSYSDILQGTIMFFGSILLLVLVLYYLGGPAQAIKLISEKHPELLTAYTQKITPNLYFSFWILVCFGVMGLPQTILRTMANQNPIKRFNAIILATIVLFVVMLSMHLSGFLANGIIPKGSLASADLVIPNLVKTVMTPTLAAIFLIAPMASIISTIDSQLIQSTSTIVNDLIVNNKNHFANKKVSKEKASLEGAKQEENLEEASFEDKVRKQINKRSRLMVRGTTLTIIALALIFSINPPQILIWLNILAFGGLQATFLWPIVLGMFSDKVSAKGAFASVITGIGTYAFLTFAKVGLWSMHQIVPSLVFSFVAFVVVDLVLFRKKA